MDDVRFALRRLSKHPAATIASLVTLAVSIGAGAATWSLLSALLLNPLPVRDPDRLVVPGMTGVRRDGSLSDTFVYPFFQHFKDSDIFEGVIADWPGSSMLVGTADERAPAGIDFVSHDFFDVLGVAVPIGRDFTAQDDQRNASGVTVLSDAYWRRTFRGSREIIGQTITVAGRPATIIGVANRGFRGLDLARSVDLFLPLHTIAEYSGPFMNFFAEAGHQSSPTAGLRLIARLRPAAGFAAIGGRLATLPLPDGRSTSSYGFTPLETAAVPVAARGGLRQFAQVLAGTVAMLVLIGCLTVGMLLLVRTEARREEFALCRALGASRARLAGGIALEGALLASAGALAAIPVATWLFRGVRAFQMPGGISIDLLDMSIDATALSMVAAAAVVTTLTLALIAGAFGIAVDVSDALRSRSGATPTVTRRHTRAFLVAAQVGIALVLVTGAALFAQSLQAALRLNPGFATDRLVNVPVSLRQYGYTLPRANTFFEDLRARLLANPAVESISLTTSQGGMSGGKMNINGIPRLIPSLAMQIVDDAFFATLGVDILEGRAFSGDDAPQGPPVGIVSASFARFLQNGSALGSRVTLPFSRPPAPPPVVEIVGVVPDLITNVTALEPMVLYLRREQSLLNMDATVVIRASDVVAAKREAQAVIKQLDRAVTPGPMLTIDERLTRQMGPQQFGAIVLGALGSIALLLTLLGTYVLAESMSVLRIREMGVRAALGARGPQLAAILVTETVRLVGIGLVLAGYRCDVVECTHDSRVAVPYPADRSDHAG
jgi:predicted permease